MISPFAQSYVEQSEANPDADSERMNLTFLVLLLIGGALLIDFFTPYFIWKGFLPGAVRWLSDLSLFVIIGLTIGQMLLDDYLPTGFLLILAITIIGATVAAFEGEHWLVTMWGWWSTFKYPFVGLLVFIQPYWPPSYAGKLLRLLFAGLLFQVLFQVGQYLSGMIPSDDLAGTFGRHGVSPLVLFIFFVVSMSLGKFLVDGAWRQFVLVAGLGLLSSVLGEMKLFPFMLAAMAAITLLAASVGTIPLGKVLLYVGLLGLMIAAFVPVYNQLVAAERNSRSIESFLDPEVLADYLYGAEYNPRSGEYVFRRGFALIYGWNSIQRDPTTFLFGFGLGTRSESESLGVIGQAFQQSDYGLTTSNSLLVFMQEFGIGGLILVYLFGVGTAARLLLRMHTLSSADATRDERDMAILAYGLALFTLFWPMWLWYSAAWRSSVVMVLYWGILGFTLNVTAPAVRGLRQRQVDAQREVGLELQLD